MLKKLLADLARLTWRSLRDAPTAQEAAPGALRERFDRCLLADDLDGALALADAALASDPGSYEARLLRGRAQQKLHELEDALASFEEALRARADDAELHDFLGALYQELGRMPEAFAAYERALALRPGFVLAQFHRAMAWLLAGDFARGWDDYELRRTGAAAVPGTAALPRWDGAPLAGRRLLISREQGLGDEIMYASILPQLMAQGGECVLECDPRLVALLRRSFPGLAVAASMAGGGVAPQSLPGPVDCVVDSASLPRFFRRSQADFPRQESYLRADPAAVARWRARLDALGPGLKVGLSWTGGVRKTRRALRSLSLEQLLPLLRTPGARFVSLQYTPDALAQAQELRERHGIVIEHWQEAIDDYDQTAALVCALDQVVSVCTSLVHLCGALGRPAWVMVPVGPEWRYGLQGEAMPWYRSVRLFRQSSYRDWSPVIGKVAAELQKRTGAPPPAGAALAVQGRYGEAIEVLRGMSGDPDAANLVGLCQTMLGQYREAMRWYRQAIDARPDHADAHLNAGLTSHLIGDPEEKRLLHRWLVLKNAVPPVPATGRVRLPEVTLCCVDSAYHELSAVALRASLARCEFGAALFLSDRDCNVPGVRFVPVPRIGSTAEYSNFMIHRLHEFVGTSHALVIQYDGFVLNPEAWAPEFLQYDFVGAPMVTRDGLVVGNGGFSLRSRKLLAALRDDPEIRAYDAARGMALEDVAISRTFRDRLERVHGMRYAPPALADRFAAGRALPTRRSFGFHGLIHLVRLHEEGFALPDSTAEGLSVVFRARGIAVPREFEERGAAGVWDAGAEELRREGARQAGDGKYVEAAALLGRALDLEPQDAATANLAGVCRALCGRQEDALVAFDAALKADPTLADAHLNAAWSATLLGRREGQAHFRSWLALRNPVPPAFSASRPRLPEVTLCCVDSAYHELSAVALRASLARCEFGAALFLSDRDCNVPGVRFVPVPRIGSTAEYSNFMIHRLHEFVGTSHALVIQYDGFVLNPEAWVPEFLQYDYIGPAVRLPDGRAGGIGGFSLRSRKLLAALRDEPRLRNYDARREPYAEDIAICCAYRQTLEERHGIRFAPGELADRFAAEAIAPTAATFGFHSLMQLASLYQNDFRLAARPEDGLRFRFRAAGPLGPLSVERELELRARGDLWAQFLGVDVRGG